MKHQEEIPMHVIQLHNRKRQGGGDCVAFERTCDVLRNHGLQLTELTFNTPTTPMNYRDKLQLLGRSLYSRSAVLELDACLAGDGPYLLHVHNLFPHFSPSVLIRARQRRIPVIFHCHNYRLTCPIEMHFHNNKTCRKCLDSWVGMCLWHNCRGNLAESMAYALQNLLARQLGMCDELIDAYIVPTRFTYSWLAAAGVPENKLALLPYPIQTPEIAGDPMRGAYVAFAGRCPPEKGLDTLLAAVKKAGLPMQVAGMMPQKITADNVTWRGFLKGEELAAFYRGARFLVVPSLWFETFGLVAGEAMSHGIPIIASRIGALAELVDDGRTGLLFSPGNADELAEMMLRLWNDPERCRNLGAAGREKILNLCHPDIYYTGLIKLYNDTMRSST